MGGNTWGTRVVYFEKKLTNIFHSSVDNELTEYKYQLKEILVSVKWNKIEDRII